MEENKMPEKSILVNTRAWMEDAFTYEDYLEYCEDNDCEPTSKYSGEFFNWKREECHRNVNCDLDNIKNCSYYKNAAYVITGYIGPTAIEDCCKIRPVKVMGLYEAIEKCWNWGDINNCKVEINNNTGVVHINAYHKNGVNIFEIRELQEQYIDAFDRAVDEYLYGNGKPVELNKVWFKKIKNLYFE